MVQVLGKPTYPLCVTVKTSSGTILKDLEKGMTRVLKVKDLPGNHEVQERIKPSITIHGHPEPTKQNFTHGTTFLHFLASNCWRIQRHSRLGFYSMCPG